MNIKRLRQENNWKQADVAKRLDISVPAFSKIETGFTDINISRLEQIAEVFQVSILDILCNTEDHPDTVSSSKVEDLIDELSESKREVIAMQLKLINLYDENRELLRRLKESEQTV